MLRGGINNKNWVKCYTKTTRTSNGQWLNKCGNKYNLLTLIKTSGGKVIGGYNYQYFRTSGNGYVGDQYAFLFSLSNLHRHNSPGQHNNNHNYGIYYHASAYSVCFGGGHDLCLYKDEGSPGWSRSVYNMSAALGCCNASLLRKVVALVVLLSVKGVVESHEAKSKAEGWAVKQRNQKAEADKASVRQLLPGLTKEMATVLADTLSELTGAMLREG